jgi:photosystem II stability/assembly factor-like uncharacterized protein
VYFLNAREGWLGAKGPQYHPHLEIYRTRDGGRTWRRAHVGDPGPLAFGGVSFDFSDPDHGIAMVAIDTMPSQAASAWVTDDGGGRWRRAAVPANGEVAFTGPERLWLSSTPGGIRLFTSGDGGRHWTRVRTPLRPEHDGAGVNFAVPIRLSGRLVFPVVDQHELELYVRHGGWHLIYRRHLATVGPASASAVVARPPSSLLLEGHGSRGLTVLTLEGRNVTASHLVAHGLGRARGLRFFDHAHGVAVGEPGRCGCVAFTADGGANWTRERVRRGAGRVGAVGAVEDGRRAGTGEVGHEPGTAAAPFR